MIPKFRKHRWLSLLGLVIVLIGEFLAYNTYSNYADHQKFIKARTAIDTIYADIVAKVGQPDNYKRTNDCSRPNQEFTQGPLSCSVDTNFIYGVDNEQQANITLKAVQAVISAHPDLLKPTKALSTDIVSTLVVNTYYHSAQDYYAQGSNMDCSVKYTYDTPREINLDLINDSNKPLQINVDCSDWAKSNYYPLKN